MTSSPAALIGAVMMSLTAPPGFVSSFGPAPTTDPAVLHPAFSGFGTIGMDGMWSQTSAWAGAAFTNADKASATVRAQASSRARLRRMPHSAEAAQTRKEVGGGRRWVAGRGDGGRAVRRPDRIAFPVAALPARGRQRCAPGRLGLDTVVVADDRDSPTRDDCLF